MPKLLDVRGSGAYLGVSPWSIRDLIWSGELPYVRIGRRHMVDVADLDGYVERAKVVAGSPCSGQVAGLRRRVGGKAKR